MVSYLFPPFGGIGTLRVAKLAKYLSQFGWEPVVLTTRRPDQPQTLPVEIDESKVVRTPCFHIGQDLARWFASHRSASAQAVPKASFWSKAVNRFIPLIRVVMGGFYKLPIIGTILSEPVGWYPYALKTGLKILRKGDIDVIFSSSQPRVCHLIASRLHHKTKIPWIAEYRDLWADPYDNNSRFYQFLETELEKRVMKRCQMLITVSEFTVKWLEAIHSKKIAVIHNGFDEPDYIENVPLTSKFTLTFTGNIYVGKRDPTLLFRAMAELQEEGKLSPDNLEVRFFGGSSLKTFLPLIEKYHLEKLVKLYGAVPFKESVRRQQESSALLLLEWDNPHAQHVFSGKLFEYLGAGRPILAIAYKTGAIDRLLQETGAGILVNKIEMAKDVLSCWLEEWRQSAKITSHWHPVANIIREYTRREQAEKLAQLLEETLAPETRKTINP